MLKRLIILFFSLLLSVGGLDTSVYAASNTAYNWYCIRNKEHKQPRLDSQMDFIEQFHGYYVDKKYGDDCEEQVVYLTFDAGYENGNIEKILNTLVEEKVSAAFFVLGNLVTSNTELVKRMIADGHIVCNHTYAHKDMTKFTQEAFETELKKMENVYMEYTGATMPKYYRPPEGRFSLDNMKWADQLGYKTIFWSFAYADWDNDQQMSKDAAKEKILSNIHNGAVILLHPTSKTNAEILGDIIRELKGRGIRFGTLDELTA